MTPQLAAAGISAIPSVIKGITGFLQARRGRKILKNTKTPDYEIQDEFNQNVQLAKDIKNMSGMPAEEYQAAQQDIARGENFGVQQLRGRGGAIAGISNVVKRGMDARMGLNSEAARRRLDNIRMGTGMQMNALNALASEKLKKQNWEKFLPFQQKIAEGQALLGAGMQNSMSGLSDISNIALADMMYQDGAATSSIFGGGGAPASAPRYSMANVTATRPTRNMFSGINISKIPTSINVPRTF